MIVTCCTPVARLLHGCCTAVTRLLQVKGVVEKLVDKYTAHVRMNSDGTLIKLDSDDLETVVPQARAQPLPLSMQPLGCNRRHAASPRVALVVGGGGQRWAAVGGGGAEQRR